MAINWKVLVRSWWLLLPVMLGGFNVTAAAPRELILLNWVDYFDPDLYAKFEQQSGIKITEVNFETDETRDGMLADSNATGYDLILIGSNRVQSYARRGWLAPVELDLVPNRKLIDPRWLTAQEGTAEYSIPVFWGTTGIAYRQDLISEPIRGWRQLLQPNPAWGQRLMMIKDSTDIFAVALKSLGYSMNSSDSAEMAAAEELLLKQKPFVKSYGYLSTRADSSLLTGQYWMAMVYNGDAFSLHKINPDVVYTAPQEGTNLWSDNLAVMASSKQPQAAWEFINFLHEPTNAAQMSVYASFATVNTAALKLIPDELRSNPIIYPPQSVLENSEFHQPLPPQGARKRKEVFNRLIN